ncbi:MAG TPA: hypothetical protein VK879_12355 [Candidatus Sulfomarinibacteraceae bacterium]|nr:hypothetical protein [Candidatus Sulfomarinibacteraceae bacterium]
MQVSPRQLIVIGFLLVLLGMILAFAMVLRVIPPSFLVSFISYGASLSGLFLGMIGLARSGIARPRRPRDEEYDSPNWPDLPG